MNAKTVHTRVTSTPDAITRKACTHVLATVDIMVMDRHAEVSVYPKGEIGYLIPISFPDRR